MEERKAEGQKDENHSHSILRYAHHLSYARCHDAQWSAYCDELNRFLQGIRGVIIMDDISIADFPEEIMIQIFAFLDYKSLCSIAITCKHYRILSEREDYWDHLMKTSFNIDKESCNCNADVKTKYYFRNTYEIITALLRGKNTTFTANLAASRLILNTPFFQGPRLFI